MSFYNMVHGVTQATFYILPMLDKHPDDYPRFRDCFVKDDEYPEYDDHIHIYTRVGGGNREDYSEEIESLQKSEYYVDDYDDSFDYTFATFVFKVPDIWRPDFEKIKEGKFQEVSDEYVSQCCSIFPKIADKLLEVFGRT